MNPCDVRSILPQGVHVMALTATATKTLVSSVSKTIGLRDPYTLSLCPCKKNLVYAMGKFSRRYLGAPIMLGPRESL